MREDTLFVCDCGDIEHQFVVTNFTDDKDSEIYVSVNLKTGSFWERLKIGLKYIFGKKSKYGAFDEIIINSKDADKLQVIVDKLKEK